MSLAYQRGHPLLLSVWVFVLLLLRLEPAAVLGALWASRAPRSGALLLSLKTLILCRENLNITFF